MSDGQRKRSCFRFFVALAALLFLSSGLLPMQSRAAPVVVNDGQRDVTIPAMPKRIVVLEFSFLDAAAAVGVTPVGAADDNDAKRVSPRIRSRIGKWTSVGLRSQPNIEVIASLKPDLIIADLARHQAQYEDLARIAPTLLLPSKRESYESSLANAVVIGKALGLSEKMEKRIAENRAYLAAIAAKVPKNETVTFGIAREKSFSVHSSTGYAGSVLTALGITMPVISATAGPTEFVTLEQLLVMNPDWLIVGHYRHPSQIHQWEKQPLWGLLTAVRKKHVAEVNGDKWSRNRGIIASEQIADDVLAILNGGKADLGTD